MSITEAQRPIYCFATAPIFSERCTIKGGADNFSKNFKQIPSAGPHELHWACNGQVESWQQNYSRAKWIKMTPLGCRGTQHKPNAGDQLELLCHSRKTYFLILNVCAVSRRLTFANEQYRNPGFPHLLASMGFLLLRWMDVLSSNVALVFFPRTFPNTDQES